MKKDDISDSFPDPTKLGKGEFAKSKQTRTTILEAAVTCLVDLGYQATSTTAVARQAKLSRTAMLYHFPSRKALIGGVVQYVMLRRVEIQQEIQSDVPEGIEFHSGSVDVAWGQINRREFLAFCELSTAARTDKELAKVFNPSLAAFDRARRQMSRELAEPEKVNGPGFDLRCDVTRFLLEGIAQQNGITFDKTRRIGQIKNFLEYLWDDDCDPMMLHLEKQMGKT